MGGQPEFWCAGQRQQSVGDWTHRAGIQFWRAQLWRGAARVKSKTLATEAQRSRAATKVNSVGSDDPIPR